MASISAGFSVLMCPSEWYPVKSSQPHWNTITITP